MTEYVLVVATIAVVVFITYVSMGQTINHFASWQADTDLTSAS